MTKEEFIEKLSALCCEYHNANKEAVNVDFSFSFNEKPFTYYSLSSEGLQKYTVGETYNDPTQEIKQLKEALLNLINWTYCGVCSDCSPGREGPICYGCPDWLHEKDCAHLETINKALVLLGRKPEEGHSFPDAEVEMKRLYDERNTK